MSQTPRASRAIVSDTSPLQCLYQTNNLSLLHEVFGGILIPRAVADEIDAGREIGYSLPRFADYPWISIVEAPAQQSVSFPSGLGAGEREAILLAINLPDPPLIVDDRAARAHAESLGIETTGLVGVILRAKSANMVMEVRPILEQLKLVGFRLDSETFQNALKIAGELRDS